MALKALLVAIAAAAICVAFIVVAPHGGNAKSQIEQIELRP
jgi:hypothetical protein